jgi:hypothetical protein
MVELLPIVLGTILGAVIYRHTRGRTRLVLSVAAVIVSGTAATVLSGEYAESWIYVLFDLGLAALGLAIGFAVGHVLLSSPEATKASLPKSAR